MKQELVYKRDKNSLEYSNQNIKICIICGHDKIESFEHGISCEECGALFRRKK